MTVKRFKGFTTYQPLASRASSANNNLSTRQYKRLSGPPLAPRREASRVISNLRTRHRVQGGALVVEGFWDDVVSAKGRPFLHAHFTGTNNLPRRDLRGVRPAGMRLARAIVREWHNRLRLRANTGF